MIVQLNPPIPVTTLKGAALAHFLIDDGPETDLQWVCFQESTGECWTFRNRFVRAQKNITQGRDYISPFYDPDDVALTKMETQLQKQVRIAKRMSVTDPFFEQRKDMIRQDKDITEEHECCIGEFTCHYLGNILTLTCQEEGRDSVHTLVKMCPFCGYKTEEDTPPKKELNDDLWHLGNEVVRLRQSLDKNEWAPGSIMAPESMIRKFNNDIKDILELLNKVRMICGNISIKDYNQ